ncbi:MAG: NYN domain-containing protein [Patescibacteria group bacterium]|mgnify:CR=1 FL=1
MDLHDLKKKTVREILEINDSFGKIFAFIDFGNVNHWFSDDDRDENGELLAEGQKLIIKLEKLKSLLESFATDIRFYYGHNPSNQGSQDFIKVARRIFSKSKVFTKPMQMIRHYLSDDEELTNTREVKTDRAGKYILIPKCNFDVEISVDAVRLAEYYDTFCLLSGDSDFLHLIRYLRTAQKKRTILIKGGYIQTALATEVELNGKIVNAQDIKLYIAEKKQKSGLLGPDLADRKPESTGRTTERS